MARIFTEGFERGTADAAITTATTDFDVVVTGPAGGGTAFVSSAGFPMILGNLAAVFGIGLTSGTRVLQLNPSTLGTRSKLFVAFYLYIDPGAVPTSAINVARVLESGTARAYLRLNTDGSLSARNAATAVWTSAAGIVGTGWTRLEWRLDATAGEQQVRAYSGHASTALVDSGAQTFNTGTFDTFQVGVTVAVTDVSIGMDWVALDDATWVGSAQPNTPPTVSAGADRTNVAAGSTVTLTGTASDPGGTIASTSWTQTGGTAVTLSGTGLSRTFTAPSAGSPSTLTFQFSATDNEGLTSSDTMTVGVLATGGGGGSPPVVSAGSDQTVEPWGTVTLSGSATDDGSITARAWTQTAGTPTVTLSGATTATATFEAPGTLNGTALTFQFSATDNAALTSTDTASVTVYPAAVRAVIGGALVPVRMKVATSTVVPRSQESAWAGPATATTDATATSAWAGPVTATTDSAGSVLVAELPFAMPSRATMAAAGKPAIALLHTMPPYWFEGSTQYSDNILPSSAPSVGGTWRQRPHPLNSNVNLTDAKRVAFWTEDIQNMWNIGLDGASQNIIFSAAPGSPRWNEHILPLYQAADNFTANNTPGFTIAPELSMLSLGNNNADAATWAGYIAPLLKRPCAQKMPDGRPVCFLYNVDDRPASWYTTFANTLQTSFGIDVAMIPSHQSTTTTALENYLTLFENGRFAMLHQWNAPGYTASVSSIGSTFRTWAASHGVPYCGSVGPSWENDRPENGLGAPKEKEGYGTLILQNMWQSSTDNNDPMVRVISWNDHEESHNFKPSTGYQWVPYDVTAYYLAKYKTGSFPTITRDALFYMHRMHLSSATYDTSRQTVGSFQGTATMVDKFLVLAFLKGVSDVTITTGGTAHLHSSVPAGVSYVEEDFVANTTARFKAVRGGVTVVPEFSSAFPTRGAATNPNVVWQDLLYRMGGSNRPPIPGVQSDMPQDRQ